MEAWLSGDILQGPLLRLWLPLEPLLLNRQKTGHHQALFALRPNDWGQVQGLEQVAGNLCHRSSMNMDHCLLEVVALGLETEARA